MWCPLEEGQDSGYPDGPADLAGPRELAARLAGADHREGLDQVVDRESTAGAEGRSVPARHFSVRCPRLALDSIAVRTGVSMS